MAERRPSRPVPGAGRHRRRVAAGLAVLLAVAVVAGVVLNLEDAARLHGAQSAERAAQALLSHDHGRLGRTKDDLFSARGSADLFGMLTAETDGQVASATAQLSVATATADVEGHSAAVLDQCLGGVSSALGQLGTGNRTAAVQEINGVATPCLSLDTGSGGGPVYPYDLADPSALVVGSITYVFGTNDEAGNVSVIESSDLFHWTTVGNALPALPAWAASDATWAPAPYAYSGHYILFYTAKVASSGQECISEATSASPAGPYVDTSSGPVICQSEDGGSIDPDPFVDPSGTPYLLWKSQALGAAPATIWSQQLDPSGLVPIGDPAALLTATQSWEGGNVEAPAMFFVNGTDDLFYSANNWDSASYGVGLAVCTTPLGSCTKPLSGPLVSSDRDFAGPGGESVFTTPSGQVEMAFHGWLPGAVSYPNSRLLFLRPLNFHGPIPTVESNS